MAKKVYIGVGGTARKVKKMYFGVDGKARKVKKAYIGVGGVARCFWSGGMPTYYGTLTALNATTSGKKGGSNGTYALFSGGWTGSNAPTTSVTAYNKSLTKSTPTALSVARRNMASASIGSYALFAGGAGTTAASTKSKIVSAYNTSLTRSLPTAIYTAVEHGWGGSVLSSFAFFSGGTDSDGDDVSTATFYDSALTRSTATLASGTNVQTVSTTDYAYYGGASGTKFSKIDASKTRSTVTTGLTRVDGGRTKALAGSNYMVLVGKTIDSDSTSVDATGVYAQAVDLATGTVINTITAPESKTAPGALTLDGFAIFAGGHYATKTGRTMLTSVDAYDENLTRMILTSLPNATNTSGPEAVVLGNYALFAMDYSYSNVVYAYTI